MFSASRDVRAVATEPIDGTPTTRYQGDFTYSEATARLNADQRAQMRPLWEVPAGSGKVTFAVWIDGRHLIHRIMMATADGKSTRLNATMNYAGFEVPVDITAPPPAQVRNRTKLGDDDVYLPA